MEEVEEAVLVVVEEAVAVEGDRAAVVVEVEAVEAGPAVEVEVEAVKQAAWSRVLVRSRRPRH